MPTFASLGVPADIARRLTDRGIESAFPIQAATLPDALAGRDICGKAPTGSGKTIAFGIPMVAAITRAAPKRPKGLILTPTRELAIQVADELRALGGDLRVLAVYGGAGIEPQLKSLRNGVDIVVACPGRLLDVIDRRACDLRDVSFAVVDEADRMADMGFLPDVRKILDMTNDRRQTLLFSATLDGAIDALVKGYQTKPVVHELPDDRTGDVRHHFWISERQGRAQLVAEIIERTGPTVVFSRTRHGADRIAKQLGTAGVSAAAIHGARSQGQRERALTAFHRGEVQALVATDVAARGIHVEGVTCVVHFDIPADHKDYVHRSGRTGRAGADGTVVALVPTAQRRDAAKLARQAGLSLDVTDPDVAVLREGHAGFGIARERGRREKAAGGAKGGSRPRRDDDRFRTDRPSGGERRGGGRSQGSRPDRPRTDRPRTERPARTERSTATDRSARRDDRSSVPRTDRPRAERAVGDEAPNRTERRQARFGPADSPERTARAAEKQRAREAGGRSGDRPRADRPASDAASDDLDRSLAGSGKVRPSGASRRKAKRAQLEAAGLPTGGTKKRRSGKPRPGSDRRR
jgi:superfamily II DNA/RNA helicase